MTGGLTHPMEQGPGEPGDGVPPPGDPASLPEAIEAARAERDEQGRVVLARARALRGAAVTLASFPPPAVDEHLTAAGEARAESRRAAILDVKEALDRLLEADADLAHAERRLARMEIEQAAAPLDDAAYARARAAALADRDDARGVVATMRRGAEG